MFSAFANNGKMLQVIFFLFFFGLCLCLSNPRAPKMGKRFYRRRNRGGDEKWLILLCSSRLLAYLRCWRFGADFAEKIPRCLSLVWKVLGLYALVVVVILAIMLVVVYPESFEFFVKYPLKNTLTVCSPLNSVAFSTSSSAATLPVTMERVQDIWAFPKK